ncbi:DUF4238 domain-containing protein [Pectobacterium odoriferum]|uniref:DUF4238 domain-containing protein n=1 Tax=Pectobacterium odoriferum TaxID=78398 RepID=UPI001CF5A85C|nr:DUF4238 domain-containing protein [Pectobacterium odoriferum]MCA6962294.1 DUF4238 domain-containing protein [Pectobacterium odoriferum]MCH5010392.1 DUF4238 domain-containing protein [Pectobacterium odoriferum]
MSKGSFQNYQHYLPATYIRSFRPKDSLGKNAIYGFVKVDAKKDQIKKVITLNATKICGQHRRHTVYIDGKPDNIIEDSFKSLEDAYPDFLMASRTYYTLKEHFRLLSGKHLFIKKMKNFKYMKVVKVSRLNSYSYIHEVESSDMKNLVLFMSRFLCYRLEGMDDYFSSKPMPKLKKIGNLVKDIIKTNQQYIPSGVFSLKNEWRTILNIIKDGGSFLVSASEAQKREFFNTIKKMNRYIAMPFLSLNDDGGVRIYLFSPSFKKPIVSGDFPFIFFNNNKTFSDGCVFTLSPSLALIFTKNKITIDNKSRESLSDIISERNVINSKKYIFSNDEERLKFFTKNIEQTFSKSYKQSTNKQKK